jgi:hypothetical protein
MVRPLQARTPQQWRVEIDRLIRIARALEFENEPEPGWKRRNRARIEALVAELEPLASPVIDVVASAPQSLDNT